TQGTVKMWERPETIAAADLVKDPKKYEGRIVAVEGVLRETPTAIKDKLAVRYSPDLIDGLDITCPGKPLVSKGDRVRIVGRSVPDEAHFTEFPRHGTSLPRLPEKP